MDISVIIYAIDLIFLSGPKVPLEGSVSRIFVSGFSFDLMHKKRDFFCHFFDFNFLHYIKLNLGPLSTF